MRRQQQDSSQASNDHPPCHCCRYFQTVCSHSARILKLKLMAEQFRICFSGPVEHRGRPVDSWSSLPFFYLQSFPDGSCSKKFKAGRYCPKTFQRCYVQTLYQNSTSDIRHNFCSAQELISSEDFQHFLTTNLLNRLPPFTLCAVRVLYKRI